MRLQMKRFCRLGTKAMLWNDYALQRLNFTLGHHFAFIKIALCLFPPCLCLLPLFKQLLLLLLLSLIVSLLLVVVVVMMLLL